MQRIDFVLHLILTYYSVDKMLRVKIFFILCFGFSANVMALQEVIWIGEVLDKNSLNINHTTFQEIKTKLDLPIKYVHANTARSLRLLSDKSLLSCRGNLRKTPERDAMFAMSKLPQVVFPGLRLYSHVPLSESDTIDLKTVSSSKLLLAVQQARNYGFNVKSFGKLEILNLHASKRSSTLINMFEKKRFDLLLEYPNVFAKYASKELISQAFEYSITQSGSYSLGYIACTDSVEGRALIKKLDDVIREIAQTDAFFYAQAQWFKYSTISPLYNDVYKTNF